MNWPVSEELHKYFQYIEAYDHDASLLVMVVSPRGEQLFIQEATPSLNIEPDFLKMEVLKEATRASHLSIPEVYGSKSIFVATSLLKDGNRLIVAKSSGKPMAIW